MPSNQKAGSDSDHLTLPTSPLPAICEMWVWAGVSVCVFVWDRESVCVIWTDILDTQFPDAENKLDSKNVCLFAFQTPDGAWTRSFFLRLHFILFLMYIIKEQFISF